MLIAHGASPKIKDRWGDIPKNTPAKKEPAPKPAGKH